MEEFNHIVRDLKSGEEEVRRVAVGKLESGSQPRALNLLYKALGDESWRVRKSAVGALVKFPDTDKAVSTLIDSLYDGENVGRRTGGVEGLIALKLKAVSGLIDAIKTEDPEVRKFLIDIMGEIKAPQFIDTLLDSVNDSDENIRLAAIEALGSLGGDRVYEKMLGLLNHSDMTIVFASLHAVGRMAREIPMPLARELLGRKILRRALFEVLGQSGNDDAVRILAEGLVDASRSARQSALRSLFKIHKRGIEQGGSNNIVDKEMRNHALGRPLDGIGEFLKSDHVGLKSSAAWALGVLADGEALGYLLGALEDDTIQGDVVRSISHIRRDRSDWFEKELKRYDRDIQLRIAELFRDIDAGALVPAGAPKPLQMSQDQFEWLRNRIADYGGLYFEKDMKYILERRLVHRLKASGCTDFTEFISYLQKPEVARNELESITGHLSTKETYFFREEFQLRAFREEIIPALLKDKEKSGGKSIRLWSAGCATGEEPYTMGMLIKEMKLSPRWDVEIYASDISGDALEAAEAGLYSSSAFRVMDDYYLKRYFTDKDGRYQISRGIQSMVQFSKLNLLECVDVPFLQNMDLIFCRNVIIYFHPDKKRKVIEDFYSLLREGGYLLLGHSESLMNLSTAFQLRHLKNDLVYQKPEKRDAP